MPLNNKNKFSWVPVSISYIALVTGTWGFLEAYTYFQGDYLKNMIGPYWVSIYLIPLPIALIVGFIRSKTKNHQTPSKTYINAKKNHLKTNTSKGDFLKYKGVLWKSARFSFQLPVPLCPHEDCERPIYHEREFPPRNLISSNLQEIQEFYNKQNTYKNIYRCPVHGKLLEVPNIELDKLKREAQFELKR